ncbi:nucleotide exchange factor GrpE [Catellatospora tritici]|uniref:nucleotide exchange factor GrpE n=1 Tax=Catellatospora tritici TaxID=2851566 RepID=UPI001C2D1469|nr:nucleotide exchange factor GrpE [Catellatospora tritici]MBV1855979.1 nucleotide exchange factor GrpE [Catellatospora tritici]
MTEPHAHPAHQADVEVEETAEPSAPQAPTAETGRVAELENRLRRALADQENLRKRYERQLATERESERARTAAVFLPVIDNLDLALQHADADPAALADGVRAVRDQAVATLATLGFPRREETGVPFDPMWHEAVSVLPAGDAAPGTVLAVVRPGYGEADRTLRPASVVVAGND